MKTIRLTILAALVIGIVYATPFVLRERTQRRAKLVAEEYFEEGKAKINRVFLKSIEWHGEWEFIRYIDPSTGLPYRNLTFDLTEFQKAYNNRLLELAKLKPPIESNLLTVIRQSPVSLLEQLQNSQFRNVETFPLNVGNNLRVDRGPPYTLRFDSSHSKMSLGCNRIEPVVKIMESENYIAFDIDSQMFLIFDRLGRELISFTHISRFSPRKDEEKATVEGLKENEKKRRQVQEMTRNGEKPR